MSQLIHLESFGRTWKARRRRNTLSYASFGGSRFNARRTVSDSSGIKSSALEAVPHQLHVTFSYESFPRFRNRSILEAELPVPCRINVPICQWRHPPFQPWPLDDEVFERGSRHDRTATEILGILNLKRDSTQSLLRDEVLYGSILETTLALLAFTGDHRTTSLVARSVRALSRHAKHRTLLRSLQQHLYHNSSLPQFTFELHRSAAY